MEPLTFCIFCMLLYRLNYPPVDSQTLVVGIHWKFHSSNKIHWISHLKWNLWEITSKNFKTRSQKSPPSYYHGFQNQMGYDYHGDLLVEIFFGTTKLHRIWFSIRRFFCAPRSNKQLTHRLTIFQLLLNTSCMRQLLLTVNTLIHVNQPTKHQTGT